MRVRAGARGETGAEQGHGVDQEVPELGEGRGGEVRAAAGEPDLHGGLAAGNHGPRQGAEVELVHCARCCRPRARGLLL